MSTLHHVSAEELAALITAAGRPPMVTAYDVLPDEHTQAALLAWARTPRQWAAGVVFIYRQFRGGTIHALITIWLPPEQVAPMRGQTYLRVPRVKMPGTSPEDWPPLPPAYPGASQRWHKLHHHAARVDPARRYGLVPGWENQPGRGQSASG